MTSTRDLTARLADLLRRERAALAEFLVAVAVFDQERRWLELGYSSLFYFLCRELGLSKSAAFQRMTAAQLIQEYPEVIEPLRDGRLCLSTVTEVAKVITPENRGRCWPGTSTSRSARRWPSPRSCGPARPPRTGSS
jgi:hypothetical protein